VVDQRDRVMRAFLLRLARHPVLRIGGKEREPIVEFRLIQQTGFVQQENVALLPIPVGVRREGDPTADSGPNGRAHATAPCGTAIDRPAMYPSQASNILRM